MNTANPPWVTRLAMGRRIERTLVGNVMVILTIDWRESWILNSDVGDWKRILINLFGISLKYTTTGFIHVSLQAARVATVSSSSPQVVVTLQVEDSGKGMSKDYQKYELYTPLAQEDPVSAGTGLGLSIVGQLAADLGGTIDIHSVQMQRDMPDPRIREPFVDQWSMQGFLQTTGPFADSKE